MPLQEAVFQQFATKGDKKELATTKDIDRWFKDAKAYGKNCTSNNLDIAFSKAKTKGKTTITFDQTKSLVKDVAKSYKQDHKLADDNAAEEALVDKLNSSNKQAHGTTGVSKTGGVEKMTDTSQYTGSHKERFDESGKGKGAAGRSDATENTGYVGNYKGAGTYDKK